MTMMLVLGMFVFERRTLPFQTLKRSSSYNYAKNSRVGIRDSYQFVGEGDESITVSGTLYPELTGGTLSCAMLRQMAGLGYPWPLLDGSGIIYGLYVISSVEENGSEYLPDGTPKKIDFTLKLERFDASLLSLPNDLSDQAKKMWNQANEAAAGVKSAISSVRFS
jgi:phage protein U